MRMTRTALIAVMMVAVASPASAYCSRSLSLALESDVVRELDYLICLHNEQVDQINDLNQASVDLRTTTSEIQDVLARLQVQIADIEDRLDALERR